MKKIRITESQLTKLIKESIRNCSESVDVHFDDDEVMIGNGLNLGKYSISDLI